MITLWVSLDITVGTVANYKQYDESIIVCFTNDFPLFQNIHTGSGTHPAFYSMGMQDSFASY
jgi:hypothetical protein